MVDPGSLKHFQYPPDRLLHLDACSNPPNFLVSRPYNSPLLPDAGTPGALRSSRNFKMLWPSHSDFLFFSSEGDSRRSLSKRLFLRCKLKFPFPPKSWSLDPSFRRRFVLHSESPGRWGSPCSKHYSANAYAPIQLLRLFSFPLTY